MSTNKTLKALEGTLAALAPLDPEQRRQVIEAAHALIEISAGRQDGGDGGCGPDAPAPKTGKRKR
jgi:hypothetical protein